MNKNKVLWFFVFVILVVFTMYTIISGSGSFTATGFVRCIVNANPFWIAAAVGCMLLFILTEGVSIKYLTDFLGSKTSLRRGFLYSSADIFFSAITPSATGGQPASAFFMIRDGIPASVTAMSLLINIGVYTISIIFIGLVCLICTPHVFMEFGTFSKVLIIAGLVIQLAIVVLFAMLVYKDRIMFRIADKLLVVAKKLHLAKRVEKKRKKLEKSAHEYKECSIAVKNHFGVIIRVFVYNVIQRVSQMMVTVCVFMAVGGDLGKAWEVLSTQGLVILGSNSVPIPGAVGVADYLFFEGFRGKVPHDSLVNVELMSRGISFYGCIILCILIVAVCYLSGKKKVKDRKG